MTYDLSKIWVWDIETNGLLRDVDHIHCMVFTRADRVRSYTYVCDPLGEDNILKGITFLKRILNSDNFYLAGHNICGFDLGVILKLYGVDIFQYYRKYIDTLLLAQLIFPKFKLEKHPLSQALPEHARTFHSLDAWSQRAGGEVKDDYDGGWENYSEEMKMYCEQDVSANIDVLKLLFRQAYKVPTAIIQLEGYVSMYGSLQTVHGHKIDIKKMEGIKAKNTIKRNQIDLKLASSFTPYFKQGKCHYNNMWNHLFSLWSDGVIPKGVTWETLQNENIIHTVAVNAVNMGKSKSSIEVTFTKLKHAVSELKYTTRNSSRWELVDNHSSPSLLSKFVYPLKYTKAGKPKSKKIQNFKEEDGLFYYKIVFQTTNLRDEIDLTHFKAGSRPSILVFMKTKYNWTPTMFTKSFNHKLDSETFSKLPYKEAPLLAERFKVSKSISQCNTLLKNVKDGRVSSNVNVMGTNTFRTTSANINMAQIDKNGEFRSFFRPNDGWVMVDADLGGCEIVMLGKYLLPFDKGRMQHIKANEDVHQSNADLAGVCRNDAKGLFFGMLYGSSATLTGYTLWFTGCIDTEAISEQEYNAVYFKLKRRAVEHDGMLLYPVKKDLYIKLNSKVVYMTIYGQRIQGALKDGIEGYHSLVADLAHKVKASKGHFHTLDGRRVFSKSSHSNLNYLLQSSNAVYTKFWYFYISEYLRKSGYKLGIDYIHLQSVYDEILHTCRPEVLPSMEKAYAWAIKQCNTVLFQDTTVMEHEFQSTMEGWDKIH